MSEGTKAMLCLIAIAVLIVVAQTMDYNDQVRMEAEQHAQAEQRRADYMAWHKAILATRGQQ